MSVRPGDPKELRVPEQIVKNLNLKKGDRVRLTLGGENSVVVRDSRGKVLATVRPSR